MSDPSALSQILGYLLMIAAILAIRLAAVKVGKWWKRQPDHIARALTECHIEPEPVRVTRPCTVLNCNDEATVYIGASHETWQFCMTHGLPYLIRQDIELTDQQVRELMDDARRITRDAATGGATA